MKSVIRLLIFSLIVGCTPSENRYVIKGTFKEKQNEEWIYLLKPRNTNGGIDSARIVNGSFEFRGPVDFPEIHYLSNNPTEAQDAIGFFLESVVLDVTIDPSDWTNGSIVSGGPINDEFFRMEAEIEDAYFERSFEINDAYSPVKEENREIHNQLMLNLRDSIFMIRKDYIRNNPESPISLIYLNKFYHTLPLEELGKILNRVPEGMHQTSLYERVAEYYALRIGQKDSKESLSNNNEVAIMNELTLNTSIIGALVNQNPDKVLYIDIWGTWCGPCRQEFPHSHRLHEKVDANQVAFIYLCVASGKENWEAMIKEEKLKGQHYLLDRELENALFKEIGGQRYYPRYVIINKSGGIEDSVAPSPSSPEIEKLLISLGV